jgi:hypothetical protein
MSRISNNACRPAAYLRAWEAWRNIYYDGQVEEELTAAEVLAKLEEAWLNEKQAPELLEPKMEVSKSSLFLSLVGTTTVP